MDRVLSPFRQSKLLNTLFLSNVFISFHYALIIYINSSFLNNFFSETQISALYIIGAIANTLLLLNVSKILEKMSNYRLAVYALSIEFISTIGLAVSHSAFLLGLYFIIHTISICLLLFNMDIFVEGVSTNENLTGSIRATYLTITSITIVIAPTIIGFLIVNGSYTYVYMLSAVAIAPVHYLIKKFRPIATAKIQHIRIRETVSEYLKNSDLYNIFASNFLLQLFYAFMVIYTPLYLEKYIGFSWAEIGVIFTIMLLPFLIFELPVGELADEKYGEEEFLTIGFVIMGLATLFLSFITIQNMWVWAIALFITRIGASFVEVSCESYFFKKVNQEKTDVISFFRVSRPLSFLVAPLLATIALQFISFQYIFIIVGTLMILGTHYSISIRDTK